METCQSRRLSPVNILLPADQIYRQLDTALDFLKPVGIAHADLKPENVLMVDTLPQPLRVRVIDFGLAFKTSEDYPGMAVRTQWYRCPEVLLGAAFNEHREVWSPGCIAAELLIGNPLFPGNDEYDMMRHIIHTTGKPPDHLLNSGTYTTQFFKSRHAGSMLKWK